MTLYGLDIIIDKHGKLYLNEINGICSGMTGFEQIYGDKRVEEKVLGMLEEKYGKITLNNGRYRQNQQRKKTPVNYYFNRILGMLLPLSTIQKLIKISNPVYRSEKADLDWIFDKEKKSKIINYPFEIYDGQDSTVFNAVNERLPHKLINDYLAEEIARNKFLQYRVLKKTEINDLFIPTSLIGLGYVNKEEIAEIRQKSSAFVVKPLLGSCGKGVRFLTKKELKDEYLNLEGPISERNYPGLLIALESIIEKDLEKPRFEYLEELIEKKMFSFEPAISIIQPFIDSNHKRNNKNEYSAIRSIVCNGKFVDAYKRASKQKRVNLSQDATAKPYNYDANFIKICETIIKIYEKECTNYKPYSYQYELYSDYLNEKSPK